MSGIHRRRVCGAGMSFQPKDLVWLDSCEKHRNEDVRIPRQTSAQAGARREKRLSPRPSKCLSNKRRRAGSEGGDGRLVARCPQCAKGQAGRAPVCLAICVAIASISGGDRQS
ncbi:hypothetical protein CN085_33340 [Sinorhizobium meliloti]|nr:hypothetical protein CN085_33340 [Sinorhizobium meliloti]